MLSSLLFYIFAGLIYSLALRKKTNYFNGHMDWKQGCATGLYMTIVIALLMPLAQASFHELIAPEFFENMINASKRQRSCRQLF